MFQCQNQYHLCDLLSQATTALNTLRAQVSSRMLTALLRCGLAVTRKIAAIIHWGYRGEWSHMCEVGLYLVLKRGFKGI